MDSKALSLLTTEELVSLQDGLVQVVQNLKFLETLPDGGAEWKRQFSDIEEQIRLRGHRQNPVIERGAEPRTNEVSDEILQGIRGIVLDDRVPDIGKVSTNVPHDSVKPFTSTKKAIPMTKKKVPVQPRDFKKEPKKPLVAIMLDSDDEKELEEKEIQEEKAYEKRAAKRFLIEYAQKTTMTGPEQISKGQQNRLRFTGRKPKVNEAMDTSKGISGSNHQSSHPAQAGKKEAPANQRNEFEGDATHHFGSDDGDIFVEESDSESEDDDGEEFGQFLDEFGGGDVGFDEDEENEGFGGIGGQGFHGLRYWNEGENDYENEDIEEYSDEDEDEDGDGDEGEGEGEGFLGDIQPDSFSKYSSEGADNIDFEALD